MIQNEIEENIYNLTRYISLHYEEEIFKTYSSTRFIKWERVLDELGIKVSYSIELGVLNEENMTITHPEYKAKYLRIWPDYSNKGKDRVLGVRKYEYSGNIERIKEAIAFMMLSS